VTTILQVFGLLELLLLAICAAIFGWGLYRRWEMEILLPVWWAVRGTMVLIITFLVITFVHDHIHLHISMN
jgi:hypothetical protein